MTGFAHSPVGDCKLRAAGGPVSADPLGVSCPVCRFNYARWALVGNLTRDLEISPAVRGAYAAELASAGRALHAEWTQEAMAGRPVDPRALQRLARIVSPN